MVSGITSTTEQTAARIATNIETKEEPLSLLVLDRKLRQKTRTWCCCRGPFCDGAKEDSHGVSDGGTYDRGTGDNDVSSPEEQATVHIQALVNWELEEQNSLPWPFAC